MNIADLRLIFKERGLDAAFDELSHYPECSVKLDKFISRILAVTGAEFQPDENDFLNSHERVMLWLKSYGQIVDIEHEFEKWLDQLEDGLWLPAQTKERLAVLGDLVDSGEPVFEFNEEQLTPEQWFLIDFGFARAVSANAWKSQ